MNNKYSWYINSLRYRPLLANTLIFLYEEVPTFCFFILIIMSLRKNRNEETFHFHSLDAKDLSETFS